MAESNKKVFIVEDDLILNLLYESYMEKLGFETTGELVYGKTAVDLARKSDPDLILMDIALEGEMDGIQAMKQIREFSEVPVIYITGNSDPHHKERAGKTGYLDYLIKPIEFEDLRASVEKHLGNIQSS
ncbi:MAG: response regulator [Balneolaceae bacterium]